MLRYNAVVFQPEWYRRFRYPLVAMRDHPKSTTELSILFGSIIEIIDSGQKKFDLLYPVNLTFTQRQSVVLIDIAREAKMYDAYSALTRRELLV